MCSLGYNTNRTFASLELSASNREHAKEGSKDGEGSGGKDRRKAAGVPLFFQPRAEQVEGRPHGSCTATWPHAVQNAREANSCMCGK